MAKFKNRADATIKLLEVLPQKRMHDEKWLLVAISAGAVPLVNAIADRLQLDYDLLFTEPIYAPNNSECVVAMVSETEEIVIHDRLVKSFDINLEYIYGEAHRKYEEKILKYVYKYRKGGLIGSLKNKKVLLVDEGCETGITLLCSLKTVINAGAKIVSFATPILPNDVFLNLEAIVDDIYSVYKINDFVNLEYHYENIKKMESEEVKQIVQSSKNYLPLK